MSSGKQEITLIGKGTYGTVNLYYDQTTNPAVLRAIKVIGGDLGKQLAISREIEILKQTEMLSMVKMTSYNEENGVTLEFEFIPGGSLAEWIKESMRDALNPTNVHIILYGIARALEFLHEKGIVHRDIKPHNVLLTPNHEPKLCDFGFARFLPEGRKPVSRCGTPGFWAPEIENSDGKDLQYGTSVDVYSFGMMVYSLVTGELPKKCQAPEHIPVLKDGPYKAVYEACAVFDADARKPMKDVVVMLENLVNFPEVDGQAFNKYKAKFEHFKWKDTCTPSFLVGHQDNPAVCYYLSFLYSRGIGRDEDLKQAEELRARAASKGFGPAIAMSETDGPLWSLSSSASRAINEVESFLQSGYK